MISISPIQLGAFVYTVETVKEIRSADGRRADGSLNEHGLTINIDETDNDKIQLRTLWHELLHAILSQSGFSFEDQNEEKVEAMLRALGYGIVNILDVNPHLAELSVGLYFTARPVATPDSQ